jgi:hypothetical protein
MLTEGRVGIATKKNKILPQLHFTVHIFPFKTSKGKEKAE